MRPKASGSCCLLWATHTSNFTITRCEEPVSQVKRLYLCGGGLFTLHSHSLGPKQVPDFSPYVSHLISFPRQHSLNLKYQGNEATALLDATIARVPFLVLIGRRNVWNLKHWVQKYVQEL